MGYYLLLTVLSMRLKIHNKSYPVRLLLIEFGKINITEIKLNNAINAISKPIYVTFNMFTILKIKISFDKKYIYRSLSFRHLL